MQSIPLSPNKLFHTLFNTKSLHLNPLADLSHDPHTVLAGVCALDGRDERGGEICDK